MFDSVLNANVNIIPFYNTSMERTRSKFDFDLGLS